MSDHYASGRARARESVGYADEHARTAQAHLAAATEEDLQNIARMKESFMSAALPGSGKREGTRVHERKVGFE